MKKLFTFVIAFCIITSPIITFAANPLVPDCNTGALNASGSGYVNACDFNALVGMVNNGINWLIIYLATPLAAIAFAYAGFLLLTSGGSEEKLRKAKTIILNVVVGFVIALAAWLIVKTILVTLGFNPKDAFLSI